MPARKAGKRKTTLVSLTNSGEMPMPLDVTVTLKNGDQEYYTIPLRIMRGAKKMDGNVEWTTAADWPWTNPTYELELPIAMKRISSIEIDASGRMLDTDRDDNRWEQED